MSIEQIRLPEPEIPSSMEPPLKTPPPINQELLDKILDEYTGGDPNERIPWSDPAPDYKRWADAVYYDIPVPWRYLPNPWGGMDEEEAVYQLYHGHPGEWGDFHHWEATIGDRRNQRYQQFGHEGYLKRLPEQERLEAADG